MWCVYTEIVMCNDVSDVINYYYQNVWYCCHEKMSLLCGLVCPPHIFSVQTKPSVSVKEQMLKISKGKCVSIDQVFVYLL